ncbi:MAG: PAS domain S-box protein, partial [Candidatus Bathyarchaeota archaeon]
MAKPTAEQLPKNENAHTKKHLIHVLHVDDEPEYLKTAKAILEMQGTFQVETASSVEEAMKKLETKNFDAIISDYIMPGIDGLEFLRELRASGNTTPFIIFTGKGREIVAIKALNLGADQYINKLGNPEAVYSELSHGIRTVVKGRRAEEALRASEKEKRAVLDGMFECVNHQDLNHKILWANSKAADCANMKPEELIGRYCYEVWGNSTKPCIGCPLEEAIKTGQPQQGEMTTPDGRIWSITSSPIKDANYQVTSVVEVATNIDEQKRAEEELRKSEARYRGLVENIGNGIATIDSEGKYTFVNQALCEKVGYSKKELLGKPFTYLLHPDDKKKMQQLFSGSGENPNRKLSVEFRALHKNGKIIYMHSSPTPIVYNNKVVGFSAILSDVTEQKKAEEALQQSEENYRNVLEQAPDLILTVNKKGIVTSCNSVLERNTDFSKNEVVGKHFLETPLLNEVDPKTAQRVFKSILEGKHPERIEIKWFLKDGTPHISELRIGLNRKDGKIA